MKLELARHAARRGILTLGLLFATAGCEDLFGGLAGGYTGPQPAREPLTNEAATIASVQAGYQGQIVFILDRTHFVAAGDPHNVNRVVKAWTSAANQPQVAALDLQAGERVTVSTEFSGIEEAAGSLNVADWPGHDASEYPIGSHRISSIARVTP
jgi:hypothetical protein